MTKFIHVYSLTPERNVSSNKNTEAMKGEDSAGKLTRKGKNHGWMYLSLIQESKPRGAGPLLAQPLHWFEKFNPH